MNFQDLVLTLQRYWSKKGCLIAQPYDIEKGAATFNPSTFLRALGPEPFHAAFIEPCRRPKDGRYGDNPNRMQHYYQFQVVLKPSPLDILDLYIGSLKEIGIDPAEHDIRFVHDDWESPTLGAWGLGWEVWLDGMEITQFTYFQQVGGIDLKPITGEITYGLERLCMYLQKVDNVFKVKYNEALTYGDLFHQNEVQSSRYNFEESNVELQSLIFDRSEKESRRLCETDLPIPGFDFCMKASHAFNLLDARGAISVNERQGYILRVRALAKAAAEAWLKNREALGYPMQDKTWSMAWDKPKVPAQPLAANQGARSPENATVPLLIELGVEEMPARVFGPLLRDLPALVEKHLKPTGLDPQDLKLFVTPRRIAISIASVRLRQADQKLSLKGPPANLAKDASGAWTKAALAFAQKNGLSTDQLKIQDNFLCAEAEKIGREGLDILAELFPKIFSEIHWYKTMGWGTGDGTNGFVRPVTWLAALLGDRVIPMTFKGIESSDHSRGHRFLHNRPVPVKADRQGYLAALREAKVFADQGERKEKIRAALLAVAAKEKLTWRVDEELLDTVTHLVEYPVPVLCSFDAKLLEIPEEVLVSEMREHQKLFALNNDKGALNNRFVAISNMECKDAANIREGNQRVVRARFADAEFFLREDKKKPLLERRSDLGGMAFLKDLGEGASIYRKTLRIEKLAGMLADQLKWGAKRETVKQIAALCKNDLTTQMVGEFPELQGVIGRYYALGEGLPQIVANGIADHYRPRNAEDGFPETSEGALVGIADRLDSLVAMFAKGKAPTGSADPFALRRACWTTIALLLRCGIRSPLSGLLEASLAQFTDAEVVPAERKDLIKKISDFFRGRAQNLFAEKERSGMPGGIAQDTFEAAVAAKPSWEDFPGLVSRLQALETFRKADGFAQIAETFKRVNNILKDAPVGATRGLPLQGLDHPAEKSLQDAIGKTEAIVRTAVQSQAWEKALSAIAGLQIPVAELFTAVMVNDPDPTLRKNRQALLWAVREVVLEVADFSAFQ